MKMLTIRRFNIFRQKQPLRFWLLAALALVATGWLGFIIYARNATVSRALNYSDCQIKYGQQVASWDGQSDKTWDDENYHYISRHFSIRASAPKSIWANVREEQPTRLSTGQLNGAKPCQSDFDSLVDTASHDYRWEGARTVGVRLGTPNLEQISPKQPEVVSTIAGRVGEHWQQNVQTGSSDRAAAWVDDGAQALIKTKPGGDSKQLWCVGYHNSLKDSELCPAKANQATAQPSAGYLITEDICPIEDRDSCQKLKQWYDASKLDSSADFSKLVGVNTRGEVLPFELQLDTESRYGYQVGAGMTVTFRYSKLTDVSNSLKLSKTTLNPGDSLVATIALGKLGPDLSKLSLSSDIDGQPLDVSTPLGISDKTLKQLNSAENVSLSGKFKVKSSATPGKCYSLNVSFEGDSKVENNNSHQVSVAELSGRYCIALPKSSTVYTYSVSSRGYTKSSLDEFTSLSAQTLASNLGWAKAKVGFKRVSSGGDFSLVLSSPDQMTSFSSGCDATYSCRTGRYVIINDERWRTATPSWNQAGGSLRDYRHMVINHEVGHWLGFGHLNCTSAGAPAPIMQQQSISLQGCKFNAWPTAAEISTLKARF